MSVFRYVPLLNLAIERERANERVLAALLSEWAEAKILLAPHALVKIADRSKQTNRSIIITTRPVTNC